MKLIDEKKDRVVKLCSYDFFQIRALCDEIMGTLCQAKALLEPVSEENFFNSLDVEVLRHYFYALDTIIGCTLEAKDEITRIIDTWEKRGKQLDTERV